MTSKTILFFIFIAMPLNAVAAGNCPAFNSGMVDAAMMATDYSQPEPVIGVAEDSSSESSIYCQWENGNEGEFLVAVGDGEALLEGGSSYPARNQGYATFMRTRVFNLSPVEQNACRKEVLKSFVWNQHCKPLMQ
jgi:hypothetical protein